MLVKYGRFEDLKETFMNAYPIEGQEEKFVALAPSHLVVQDKDSYPIRLTVDYTTLNNFFSKASNMLNPIESKVLEMRAHKFVIGMDISKQYHMIMSQHPHSQCILHRDLPNQPLDVYLHRALIMGHISSSSLAGLCMVQVGKNFDDLLQKARNQTIDHKEVYAPLSYALKEGILNPSSISTDFSLEKVIRNSLYADNPVLCKDSSSELVKEAVALILSLNAHSFKVHEVFANTTPELSVIKTLIDSYGGYMEIHPEMLRIMKDLDESNETRDDADTPPEDQPSNTSDDPPQGRNRKHSSNHISLSDPNHISVPDQNHISVPDQNHNSVSDQNHNSVSDLNHSSLQDSNHESIPDPNHDSQQSPKPYSINLITKSFLYKKTEEVSILDPKCLLKVYGLILQISKSPKHGLLDNAMSYGNLAKLAQVNLDCVSLRTCSILLGSLWEASPYTLTPLKAPLKIALHLSHKVRQVLTEHRKLVLALLSYNASSGKDITKLYHKYKDHPIYRNLINLSQTSMKEQVAEVKKQLVLISWDSNLILIKQHVLACDLITEEVKSFISEAVSHILKQLNIFSKLAVKMSCLKIPLQFTPNCECSLVEDDSVQKLMLCFTDSSPLKENFLAPKDKPKFSYHSPLT